jgi:predicted nuclease with TOPRIM domain
MPDITAIAQALGALKAMKDIAEATIGLHNAVAFRERQIEFQGKIIDAQNALSALQEERTTLIETIREREEEIARLKAWEAEKQKYELQDVGHGAFAYVRKTDAEPAEPPHWLCPAFTG